jgi:hypothetical protein
LLKPTWINPISPCIPQFAALNSKGLGGSGNFLFPPSLKLWVM